jgi:hypothetical protein
MIKAQVSMWRVAGVLAATLMASDVAIAGTVHSPTVNPASNVDIRVESWLEARPHAGFVPVRLRIRNGDTEPHTWTFQSDNGQGSGVTLSASLTVEPGRTGEREVYCPVTAQTDGSYAYGSLSFMVNGYGVQSAGAGSLHHTGSYGGNRSEFVAMGKKLASVHWSGLRSRLHASGSSRSDLHGSEVDILEAPEDWRGYAGIAQLWMDETEWQTMAPAAKIAMLDWVAMGGRVYVLATDVSESRAAEIGLAGYTSDGKSHGAGEVMLMRWDGKNLPMENAAREIRGAEAASTRFRLSNYDKRWSLRDLAGELTLKSGLIFGFIAVFGILVGPVNLFWLAPAGKRQRMFWTTPLLSLAGSLLLLAVMVLQDGIGGSGARLTLAILQPEQKRIAMMQEQVSRTGVLLGRSFPVKEPGWMQQLELISKSGYNPVRENRSGFAEDGSSRSGDWFASRSVQAQLLQTVRPTRAAIEVTRATTPGQPPTVVSSMETPLKTLFIVDSEDAVWVANDVGTGEKKVAQASTRGQLDEWLRDGPQKLAGPIIGAALAKLKNDAGFVFAEATDPKKFAVPTLTSIHWDHDRAFVAGPFIAK